MDETYIEIVVIPKSSRNRITVDETSIRVYLTSPPVEGKANRECIALLSKKLGIPKSSLMITRGLKGKNKRLKISGLSTAQIKTMLSEDNK